jgi:hypothetical protein
MNKIHLKYNINTNELHSIKGRRRERETGCERRTLSRKQEEFPERGRGKGSTCIIFSQLISIYELNWIQGRRREREKEKDRERVLCDALSLEQPIFVSSPFPPLSLLLCPPPPAP